MLNNSDLHKADPFRMDNWNFSARRVYSKEAIQASLTILAVEITLGLLGNVTLLASLRRTKRNQSVSRILLQNLCLIGTLSSLTGMPSLLSALVLSSVLKRTIPAFVCKARYFTLTFFFVANSINICLLSLDRYDFITRPFRRRITNGNVKRFLAFVWAIPLPIGALHLAIKINSTDCILLSSTQGPYSKPMNAVLCLILVATCCFVTLTNFISLKSMRNVTKQLNVSKYKRDLSERKMTFLTLKIVVTYVLSLLPYFAYLIAIRMGGFRCVLCNDMPLFIQLLAFTIYIANPFIFMGYFWRGRRSPAKPGVDKVKQTIRRKKLGKLEGKVRPFVAFSQHNVPISASLGEHVVYKNHRIAPSEQKKKDKKSQVSRKRVEYINQGTQTAAKAQYADRCKQSINTSNYLHIILLDLFSIEKDCARVET